MADHTEFLEMALELINENGRLVYPLDMAAELASPGQPWKGTKQAPVVMGNGQGVMAVALPFRGFEFGSYFEASDMFRECSQVLLIAGGQGEFETAKLVRDEGKEYTVAWVQRMRPADLTIMYAIGVDR